MFTPGLFAAWMLMVAQALSTRQGDELRSKREAAVSSRAENHVR
jgi:hypothetical protein